MSYFYRTGLSEVVNASLSYTGKDITETRGSNRNFHQPSPNEFILEGIEDLSEEEELQRNSITYQAFMKHEVLYIQFKQRKYASFTPKKPSQKELSLLNRKYGIQENDNDDDDDTESVNELLRSDSILTTSSSMGGGTTLSSETSTVMNEQIREELIAQHGDDYLDQIDEIDVRIAQLQHKRERQGKRRLKYQKQGDKRSWNSVRKSAPFDNLMNVERESRMDIEEIEDEYLFEIEELWEQNELTAYILFQIEERKARDQIRAEEVDDAGDVVQKELELDDLLEEGELRRVVRQLHGGDQLLSIEQDRQNSPLPTQVVAQNNNATNDENDNNDNDYETSLPRRSISNENNNNTATTNRNNSSSRQQYYRHHSVSVGSTATAGGHDDDTGRESYLKRERLPIPSFQSFRPPKKPAPPPKPKSDEQIMLEMKVRKEKYSREAMIKQEEIERDSVLARFRNGPLTMIGGGNRKEHDGDNDERPSAVTYSVGTIEERLANLHRMDLRAPTY